MIKINPTPVQTEALYNDELVGWCNEQLDPNKFYTTEEVYKKFKLNN